MSRISFIATVCAIALLSTTAIATTPTYTFTPIPWTISSGDGGHGINDSGAIVGTEGAGGGNGVCGNTTAAFLYSTPTLIVWQVAPSCYTYGLGINKNGTVVGYTTNQSNNIQGLIRNNKGAITTYSYPGAVYTRFDGINNKNEIVGSFNSGYDTASGHGLIYVSAKWSQYDVPSSLGNATEFHGVNNKGSIVGGYYGVDNKWHGMLLLGTKLTTIDAPSAVNTYANSINDQGVIVGSFLDSNGVNHGFRNCSPPNFGHFG